MLIPFSITCWAISICFFGTSGLLRQIEERLDRQQHFIEASFHNWSGSPESHARDESIIRSAEAPDIPESPAFRPGNELITVAQTYLAFQPTIQEVEAPEEAPETIESETPTGMSELHSRDERKRWTTHARGSNYIMKPARQNSYELAKEEESKTNMMFARSEASSPSVAGEVMFNNDFHQNRHPAFRTLARMVSTWQFESFFATLIFGHAILLGLQIEWECQNLTSELPTELAMIHITFTAIFLLEIILRVTAFGAREYFTGPSYAWNFIDVFLVPRHTPPLNGLICYMFMKSHLIICHQIIWTVSPRSKRGQQALRVAICLFPWTTNSLHVGRIFAPGAGSSHRNPCRCFDRGDWKQVWATGNSSSCNINKNSRIKLPHKPSSNKPISRWMIYDQWLTLFKWNPCLVWIPLHGLSWFSMIGQLCQRKFPHFAHLAPRPFCSGLAHHSLAALHPSIAAPGFLHRCDFEVFGLVHHPLIHHYLPLFHLVRGRESGPFYFRRAYSTRGIDRSGFTSTFWFCSNINAHALQSYLWWSRMATCSQFIEWEHWLGFLAFG